VKKIKIGIFVEGTFLPSFEGATQRFVALAENLSGEIFEIIIIHCFRGWSDKVLIKDQNYTTYFIPPDIFYNDILTIERIISSEQLEVIMMSNYEMILQIGYNLKRRMGNLLLIFEVHDISYDYNKSFNLEDSKIELEKRFEYLAFNISDICLCFNSYDKKRITDILLEFNENKYHNLDKVIEIPFGITHNKTKYVGANLVSKNVLFLGNMYHTPNMVALREIYYKILPEITTTDRLIKFFIVGDVPDFLLKECHDNQLIFLGKVENLEEVFKDVALGICPIFYGSGIKVKMLDYCQAGMPILCSSQSLRGIIEDEKDEGDFEVEDDIAQFGARIISLLGQPNRLKDLSHKTKKYVKRQSWTNIRRQLSFKIQHTKASENIQISEQDRIHLRQLNPYFLDYYYRLNRFKDIKTEKIYKGGFGNIKEFQVEMDIGMYAEMFKENYPEIKITEFALVKEGGLYDTFEINRSIIVKFPKIRKNNQHFIKEIDLLARLKEELQIAIPVLNFNNKPDSSYRFLGYKRINGVAFDIDGDEKSLSENLKILSDFFEDLSLIEPPQSESHRIISNWKKYYLHLIEGIITKAYSHIPQNYKEDVERIINSNHSMFIHSDFNPMLIHSDLKSEHLICNPSDNIIFGVIDWGDATFGDISFEYARFLTEFGFNFYHRLIQKSTIDLSNTDFKKIAFYSVLIPFNSILNGIIFNNKTLFNTGCQKLGRSLYTYEAVRSYRRLK
jgi:hypothetical protein